MTDDSRPTSPLLRPLDFVFLLRPTALVPLWIFQLAGVRAAADRTGVSLPFLGVTPSAVIGLCAMTLVLAGGYVLNQIVDRESDRRNRKLFLIADGLVSTRAAWAEMSLIWIGAVLLSLGTSPAFRIVLACSVALNVTYSAPPVRIKGRPFWDLVWNGLGFGVLGFAAGWSSVAAPELTLAPRALAYGLAVAGVIASTTIPDIEGDAHSGLRTTGVVLGARRTSALALLLLVAAAAVGWYARDPVGLFGPILSLPLLLRAHTTGRRQHRVIANQASVAAFALLTGVRAPLLFLLLGAAYFASRGYYKARFGMAFPGRGTP